jgi:hypothetical protein
MQIVEMNVVWAIVSISEVNNMKKQVLSYMIIAMFLILFTIIYEWFSFGVTSFYMRLSFLLPIIGGFFSLLAQYFKKPKDYIISLWHMSLFQFAAYMILTGVFEIYGGSEPLVYLFLVLGILLSLITVSLYVLEIKKGVHL